MANNKVQLADGTVLIDITDTTAQAEDVISGSFFYDAAGIRQEGVLEVDQTYSITKTLTNVTTSVDNTKIIAGNDFFMDLTATKGYQISTIVVTMNNIDITDQVFKPGTDKKTITENGTYFSSDDNLVGYSSVIVNVSNSELYSWVEELGLSVINGTINVTYEED